MTQFRLNSEHCTILSYTHSNDFHLNLALPQARVYFTFKAINKFGLQFPLFTPKDKFKILHEWL